MAMKYESAVLPNGLRVVAEVNPDSHTAAAGFFVKTGARDEAPDLMGVSHFLEHMMFKGTPTRSAEEVDRDFDDIGADHNAFTSTEMTAFWAHGLPDRLPRLSEILADILRPALRDEDFDNEKKVILEEIAMYEDNPFWVLYEQALETYYSGHPLAHRVLGTDKTITDLKVEQMREYFTSRYSADNTVVAFAGKLDFKKTVDQLGAACGSWVRTDAKRDTIVARVHESDFTRESDKVNRHYLLMMMPGPSQQDDRRYAAAVLSQILGDSEGSRLYWSLGETGLAEEAVAQHEPRDGTGEMLVYAASGPEQAEEVEAIVRKELASATQEISEDDLLRVRSKIATAVTIHGELPGGRMRRLGRMFMYGDQYRTLEEELARINAVTIQDLREVAEAFPLVPKVVARLKPIKS
ncbi:MAG TPA: pitrilysin family protein [Phycisphaerales bacterium]|nr:pitrilysin family protein [Phycisphaerales bacterium]